MVLNSEYLAALIYHAAMTVMSISSNIGCSPKDNIVADQFAIDIIELLYSDGNVRFYSAELSTYYYYMVVAYVRLNDGENALKALGRSRDYAVINVNLPDEMDYTAPLINRLNYKKAATSKNYVGNSCNLLLDGLKDSFFDFIRDSEAFKEIVADLEKYAEQI